MKRRTNDQKLRLIAALGLGLGGVFGLAGSLTTSPEWRGVAWGIDGVALVVASALLTVRYLRLGEEWVAAGFIVFAVGQGLILSGAAMEILASRPSFGAGASLWAAALVLISGPRVFPFWVRMLGLITAVLFAITAVQIFAGVPLHPKSEPMPFYAYPVFFATLVGWIWSLVKESPAPRTDD